MKVVTALCLIGLVYADPQNAPYPPSGYRPEGEPFTLPPTRFSAPQYQQPQTEYGAPEPQYSAPQIYPSQLQLPYKAPVPFNEPQVQYGAPAEPQVQYGSPAEPQREYGAPQEQNGFSGSPENQSSGFARPQISEGQEQYDVRSNYAKDIDDRGFGSKIRSNPTANIAKQRKQPQPLKSESPQSSVLNNKGSDSNNENFEEIENKETDTRYGPPIEDSNKKPTNTYGPPSTTTAKTPARRRKPSRNPARRRRPRPTTTTEQPNEIETEERTEAAVSVANAFSGRYYLLLPNGSLQRVEYKATGNEDNGKNNEVIANFMVQNVEPIKDPIYTYTSPVVQLNK